MKKVKIKLTNSDFENLVEFQNVTEKDNLSELFSEALHLYVNLFTEVIMMGNKIFIGVDQESAEEVVMWIIEDEEDNPEVLEDLLRMADDSQYSDVADSEVKLK